MHRSRLRQSLRAFTLTEVVIAIALVLLLLLGVSRVFSLTAQTIGAGQSLSTQLRAHRAIQQNLARDFLGSGTISTTQDSNDVIDPGKIDPNTGIVPVGAPNTSGPRLPSLVISNFRVAAFANDADRRSSQAWQALTPAQLLNDQVRSNAIRDVDLLDPAGPATGSPRVPLFQYGQRNFRVDTISFWSRGKFQRQTGNLPFQVESSSPLHQPRSFVSSSTGSEAWIWYGNLSVFNGFSTLPGTGARLTERGLFQPAALFGPPGLARNVPLPTWYVTDNTFQATWNNTNNQLASSFRLGRMAFIFKPAVVNGLVLDDNGYAEPFMDDDEKPGQSDPARLAPFDSSTAVYQTTRNNEATFVDPTTDQRQRFEAGVFGQNRYRFAGRFDVAEGTVSEFRSKLATYASENQAIPDRWYNLMNGLFYSRFWVNPFVSSELNDANAHANLGIRSSLLADNVSQFVVEFAGDFLTQNPATGAVTSGIPDGVVDFAVVNGTSVTKWYGMPRDVDLDGVIPGRTNTTIRPHQSPDVVPVRDLLGSGGLSFEKTVPTNSPLADYLSVFDEAANVAWPNASLVSVPDLTSYVCAWGPAEFDAPLIATNLRSVGVPSLIRIIVETRDPRSRNQQPVTQEHVFRVKP